MDSFNEAWNIICEYCKNNTTTFAYDVWIKKIEPVGLDFDKGEVTLLVPNDFHRQTLQKCYIPLLNDAFDSVFGTHFQIVFQVPQEVNNIQEKEQKSTAETGYDFTFDTFIVGSSNKFAHAASIAVAQNPAGAYNPLFLYGHSGLGKTHLLCAISNEIKKNLKNLSNEDKRVVGSLANEITKKLEEGLKAKHDEFYRKELNEKLKQERIDVTLPGKYTQMGRVHPLTSTTNEITAIFQSLGFSIVPQANAPEVETEYFNFDALNVPKDHPARDVQDTFYTEIAKNVVLRSQTSNAQIHAMEGKNPPIRIISPGRVYRNENINARKNNFFHQIEGLYVDKDITFGDLKGVLNEFIRTYFGASRPTRFRSSFFPFTEPSAEVDVQCIMCEGKGCRTCSGTGWLEVLGCGMVDPNVLRGVGIDPDVYTGFAFGMGVERLAMLKYAIDDIRLFFNDDVRFLKQF